VILPAGLLQQAVVRGQPEPGDLRRVQRGDRELVQGFTSAGVPFHVTCPIAKTATVTVTVRPAPDFAVTQIEPGLGKLAQSLRRTSDLLELEPQASVLLHPRDPMCPGSST
jgi:hypothetical protein